MSGAIGYALCFFSLVNREENFVLGVLGCVGEANISKSMGLCSTSTCYSSLKGPAI